MDAFRDWLNAVVPANFGGGTFGAFAGEKWNERLFQRFVGDRAGDGGNSVFWQSNGELIDLNRGIVVSALEGLEVARVVEKPRMCVEEEDCHMTALIASRKIIFHRDPDSKAYTFSINVMGRIREGIDPIQYPYQVELHLVNIPANK